MKVEKIMLISEELGRVSKDFLNGYKGINIELNSKEINGVFTDLYINDEIKKELIKNILIFIFILYINMTYQKKHIFPKVKEDQIILVL